MTEQKYFKKFSPNILSPQIFKNLLNKISILFD